MKILLYNPDNGVTRNFMPHLWMFLLQALTPPEHEVQLVDGNARPMSDAELVQFVLDQKVELVGIGAMTRMIAKAYRVADALRAKGISVVMGGPHVTEVPDEALGRDGGPRHADAIALGEATKTVPYITDALKAYEFTVRLGIATNTDDAEGEAIGTSDLRPDDAAIKDALNGFIGDIQQVPPQFSAVKIDGQRAYKRARDGEEMEIDLTTREGRFPLGRRGGNRGG